MCLSLLMCLSIGYQLVVDWLSIGYQFVVLCNALFTSIKKYVRIYYTIWLHYPIKSNYVTHFCK